MTAYPTFVGQQFELRIRFTATSTQLDLDDVQGKAHDAFEQLLPSGTPGVESEVTEYRDPAFEPADSDTDGEEPSSAFCVVFGSPLEGLSIHGPFPDHDDALRFAEDFLPHSDWWIASLIHPSHEGVVD